MAEDVKVDEKKAKTAYETLKEIVWQLLGGLIMDIKDGRHAISLTKTITFAIAAHCLYAWHQIMFGGPPMAPTQGAVEAIHSAVVSFADLPEGELYTLWGLLGLSGLKVAGSQIGNVIDTLKGSSDGK